MAVQVKSNTLRSRQDKQKQQLDRLKKAAQDLQQCAGEAQLADFLALLASDIAELDDVQLLVCS